MTAKEMLLKEPYWHTIDKNGDKSGWIEIISGWMEKYAKQQVKNCSIPDVVGQSEQLVCDVCGSNDVMEAPHMGRNCNRCNP